MQTTVSIQRFTIEDYSKFSSFYDSVLLDIFMRSLSSIGSTVREHELDLTISMKMADPTSSPTSSPTLSPTSSPTVDFHNHTSTNSTRRVLIDDNGYGGWTKGE